MFPRRVLSLLVPVALVWVAPARADKITMGSDLKGPADLVETHGADTAFWPITIAGKGGSAYEAPEDAQVISVTVKGAVLKEKGAANPATLIHFQSLEPAGADGSRVIYLSSAGFEFPIDNVNAVTTYTPENLCIHKGGTVAFNEIGGFMYGGSLSAPLDNRHYLKGAPYQLFSSVATSSTARYTANDGTKNGMTVYSQTANQQVGAPAGTINQGQEMLMQWVLATGNDRSEPCGGPRRHPDGSLVVPPPAMHVIGGQSPYVRKSGQLEPAIYCAGPNKCDGTAAIIRKNKVLAKATFSVNPASSGRIPMRISRATFNQLRKAAGKRLFVTFALVSPLGNFSKKFFIKN